MLFCVLFSICILFTVLYLKQKQNTKRLIFLFKINLYKVLEVYKKIITKCHSGSGSGGRGSSG